MTTPLYIRIRGAVQGPLDLEKLQLLVRRGQLGRMHEVSRDGLNWSRAADFPEIFEAAKAVAQAKLNESRRFEVATPAAKVTIHEPNPATEGPWYYASGGKECGPLEFPALRDLAARGEIRPDTLVWTPRLPAWMPVGDVSGLGLFSASSKRPHDTSNSLGDTINVHSGGLEALVGDLPENLGRAATKSRGWALLIVIVLFVMAALSALSGMVLLGLGIGRGEVGLAVSGLVNFASAIVLAIAGTILNNYSRQVSRIIRTQSVASLEAALRALNGFWAFVGVMMALGLVIYLILVVNSIVVALSASRA